MMCIVWQQQQITALSEEVKCLKLLVENINKDKEVTLHVQKGTDENMKENKNKENKKAGKCHLEGKKIIIF